jgi:hypothetical protein
MENLNNMPLYAITIEIRVLSPDIVQAIEHGQKVVENVLNGATMVNITQIG